MKKVVTTGTYNIAWFKLAECVSRGEKERALGVYRLLSHSIDDSAIQQQLEGDLFLSFNDHDEAKKRYEHAIQLYKKEERFLEAVAVYEHLLVLEPKNVQYLKTIIDLYTTLRIPSKIAQNGIVLIRQLLGENNIDEAIAVAVLIEKQCDAADSLHTYQEMVFALCNAGGTSQEVMQTCLYKAIDLILKNEDETLLQQFLSTLEVTDARWYKEAKKYLAK